MLLQRVQDIKAFLGFLWVHAGGAVAIVQRTRIRGQFFIACHLRLVGFAFVAFWGIWCASCAFRWSRLLLAIGSIRWLWLQLHIVVGWEVVVIALHVGIHGIVLDIARLILICAVSISDLIEWRRRCTTCIVILRLNRVLTEWQCIWCVELIS